MDNTQAKISELEKKIKELEKLIKTHTHNEIDGTTPLSRSQKIDAGQYYASGDAAFIGQTNLTSLGNIYQGIFFTGGDNSLNAGVENTQITLFRDEVNDESLLFGLGGIVLKGNDLSVDAGSTTVTIRSAIPIEKDALIGQRLTLFNGSIFQDFSITANNKEIITVSAVSVADVVNGTYIIYQPVKLGYEAGPWSRLILSGGTGGGIQFGAGTRNNGQNGLFYASGQFLYYMSPDGTTKKITPSSFGTPEGSVVGSIGDMHVDPGGNSNTTLYVKVSGTNTTTGWRAIG